MFFEGIVNIAREYLAFEDIAFESLDRKVETKELLEDILEAGIFGRKRLPLLIRLLRGINGCIRFSLWYAL